MTVREIIVEKLKELGADGLCTHGCGCGVEDLAPCGSDHSWCVPARRRVLPLDESEWTGSEREMVREFCTDPGDDYFEEMRPHDTKAEG